MELMQWFRKKTMNVIFGILLLPFIFGGSIFGQCTTCASEPKDLKIYFEVMDGLLNVLDTPSYQQGTGNSVVEEGKEVLFATKSALSSTLTTLLLTNVFVFQTVSFEEGGGLQLLFGTESRRRDWAKLLSYDEKITMKGLTVAQKGLIGKKLSTEQLDKIDILLKKLGYVELNKQDGKYITELTRVKYENMLTLFWNFNYLMKKLHQKKWFANTLKDVGNESVVVDDLSKKETTQRPEREALQRTKTDIQGLIENIFLDQSKELRDKAAPYLTFTNEYIDFVATVWTIQDEYQCSIGTKNECNGEWKTTIQSSWENTKNTTKDFNKSMKMFSEAWGRLLAAFGGGDETARKSAKQREESLVNSVFGEDLPQDRKWRQGVTVNRDIENNPVETAALWKWMRKNIFNKGLSDEEKTPANAGTSSATQAAYQEDANNYPTKSDKKEALKKYKEETINARWMGKEIELQGVYVGEKREIQSRSVQNVFTDIFVLQQDWAQESLYKDVRSTTSLFPVLSATVWRNKELWGEKNEPNSDNPTIYNSAGKVCELQCENVGGKCRYYTK